MNPITLETIKPIVIEKLQNLAQEHHRTLEEEINVILENAVSIQQEENSIAENREDCEGNTFWAGLQKFRRIIQDEGVIFTDEDFADLRDRSVGREIDL
jgi:hypothetical protein